MIDVSIDGHMHTRLCHHASGEMEEYVLVALDRGLKGICFLEHMEAGIDYFETTWLTENDFDFYFAEGKRLQELYKDQLKIELGVEVGYNPFCKTDLLKRLSKRTWDRIGISYHFYKLPGSTTHLNLVSRKKENVEAFDKLESESILHHYLDTLIEAVMALPGTVLCHLDAALRYQGKILLTRDHFEQIAALLDEMKKKSMALEVNTSGIGIRKEPFPSADIIDMARTRGIPLVAGSDAHKPNDVGRYFSRLNRGNIVR